MNKNKLVKIGLGSVAVITATVAAVVTTKIVIDAIAKDKED